MFVARSIGFALPVAILFADHGGAWLAPLGLVLGMLNYRADFQVRRETGERAILAPGLVARDYRFWLIQAMTAGVGYALYLVSRFADIHSLTASGAIGAVLILWWTTYELRGTGWLKVRRI